MSKDSEIITIAVMGDGGTGKSCATLRFIQNEFADTHDPTISDSYRTEIMIDKKKIYLQVQDTAGQTEFKGLWGQWIQSADGFLLVYDVTKKGSLDFLIEVLKNIKRGKDTEISQHSDENLPVFPMVVFGNKTDLEQSRELSAKEGKLFAQKHLFSNQQKISEIQQMPYFLEGSAKLNTNIQAAFESVVRQIIRYKAPQKQVVKPKKKKGFMFSISGSDDIDEIINPS